MLIGQAKDWTGELHKIKVKLGLGLGRGWSWSCWEGRGGRGKGGMGEARARVELLAAGPSKKTDGRTTLTAQHNNSSTELSSKHSARTRPWPGLVRLDLT